MDEQEERNEFRINAYGQYLKAMEKRELLEYFNDMDESDLIEFIKSFHGNDGKDDGLFDS